MPPLHPHRLPTPREPADIHPNKIHKPNKRLQHLQHKRKQIPILDKR